MKSLAEQESDLEDSEPPNAVRESESPPLGNRLSQVSCADRFGVNIPRI